jgi:hypothetical protein
MNLKRNLIFEKHNDTSLNYNLVTMKNNSLPIHLLIITAGVLLILVLEKLESC